MEFFGWPNYVVRDEKLRCLKVRIVPGTDFLADDTPEVKALLEKHRVGLRAGAPYVLDAKGNKHRFVDALYFGATVRPKNRRAHMDCREANLVVTRFTKRAAKMIEERAGADTLMKFLVDGMSVREAKELLTQINYTTFK